MAVVLRLQRQGKKTQPSYRIVAINSTKGPTGKPIEVLGTYHPKAEKISEKIVIKLDRYEYWISVGAKPSETLKSLVDKLKESTQTK
jgi:small subunit ribosomal protein S16